MHSAIYISHTCTCITCHIVTCINSCIVSHCRFVVVTSSRHLLEQGTALGVVLEDGTNEVRQLTCCKLMEAAGSVLLS